MRMRSFLMKLSFLLAGLSLVFFSIVLEYGLVGFISAFIFVILAALFSKPPKGEPDNGNN
ncbi:hypothetical protein BTS2_2067 [Bacillus sp. TS-2]|nr:hypothetical protein BTS2_2067 [Bacillus sp. TS-2]